MAKFVKSNLLYVNNNGVKEMNSNTEVITINVNDEKNCKPLKLIDTGTKAKSCFIESLEVSPVEKKFRQNCLKSFQVLVTHLKSKLALESTIMKNCTYLDPRKKGDKENLSAISNLTSNCLSHCKVPYLKFSTKEEVRNKVRNEWRVYQMEVLPEFSFITNTTEMSSDKNQRRQQP